MSAEALISQIKDDYLTCSICFNSFCKPKALPCLHTYCMDCLRDYTVSRGFDRDVYFPCPICRANTAMPSSGVQGFPDNHLMASLSDTVDKSAPFRPQPKPRRSLGKPQAQAEFVQEPQISSIQSKEVIDITADKFTFCHTDSELKSVPQHASSFQSLDIGNEDDGLSAAGPYQTRLPASAPPWPVTTSQQFNQHLTEVQVQFQFNSPADDRPDQPVYPPLIDQQILPSAWNPPTLSGQRLNAKDSVNSETNLSHNIQLPNHETMVTNTAVYPSLPIQKGNDSIDLIKEDNLILSFGKLGSSVRDFLKPIGLAISKDGSYVVSDSRGDQNRILIFNTKGELTKAFNCGCKVKDLLINKDNEILVVIQKNVSAIRHFTMTGIYKGEYGSFFTFEEPSGIGQLSNGGVVLTGTQNHCIYVLTDKIKLATKFGRKGKGDGYFQYPGHVVVDSNNNIIVTDKINNCVQVFSSNGKFKHRFGETGIQHGQLQMPLGVCVDSRDNIIVADSGNNRVEVFSVRGRWMRSVITNTNKLGVSVIPINVAVMAKHVAVLLRGPYFAEVRVYSY